LPNNGSSWYFEMRVCKTEADSNGCVCFQHKEHELEKCGGGEMALAASV
jgi:hypothetical protein